MKFKTDQDLLKLSDAEAFFFRHAGYNYNSTETPRQGRVRCAKAMAKAEHEGKEANLVFVWDYDDDADISWMSEKTRKDWLDGRTEMLYCYTFQDLPRRCCGTGEQYRCNHGTRANVLAALGGIHIATGDRQYARVIEAELALEALDALIDIGAEVNA